MSGGVPASSLVLEYCQEHTVTVGLDGSIKDDTVDRCLAVP